MLRWLLRRMAVSFERKWNYDASYPEGDHRHQSTGGVDVRASHEPRQLPPRLGGGGGYGGSRRGLWPVHTTGRGDGRNSRACRRPFFVAS